jgi:hypothetical protein
MAPLRAQLTKLRTLRPVTACLLVAALPVPLLAALAAAAARRGLDTGAPELAGYQSAGAGLTVLPYAQVLFIVLGALVVGSEYTSGLIHVTLAAVPRRGHFYLAELAAGTLLAAPAAFAAVLLAQAGAGIALGPHAAPWDSSGLPRALLGGALHLVLFFLLAAGTTALLRQQVVSLAVLLGLFPVGTALLRQLPGAEPVVRYAPDLAGARMTALGPDLAAGLSPAAGAVVLAGWTAVALLAGWIGLRYRDA